VAGLEQMPRNERLGRPAAGGLFEILNWWTTKGCLADGFLARPAFFAGLAFLPALRFGFAAAGSGAFD